jgi:hypothetical protein
MKKTLLAIILTIFSGFSGSRAHYAAGILPYAVDGSGKIKILLGSSSVHADQLSDFGGLADASDNGCSQVTAAREGCEELMFIFDKETDFKRILVLRNRFKKKFDITKAASSTYDYLIKVIHTGCPYVINNGYVMYFVQIPYQEDMTQRFLERKELYRGLLPRCWNETVKFLWVDLDTLLEVMNKKYSKPVDYRLYNPFVKSLKMAHEQNIIAGLQH